MNDAAQIPTSALIEELKLRGYRCIRKEKLRFVSVDEELYSNVHDPSEEKGRLLRRLSQQLGRKALASGVLPHTRESGVNGRPIIRLFATFLPFKPEMNFEAIPGDD